MNWIIDGAERVIKNRDIFISSECEAFKQKFIKESDSVAMYEADFLETMKASIYFKTVTDAYLEYKVYCQEAGHKYPLGRNNFVSRMEHLGFEKTKQAASSFLEKNYLKIKVVNETE
ncbi:primase-like DNA-binding domain-containing protein [Methylobacter psychrophilus]|uniref:primase-like DNA-binding domain-containing protein n=1 Tax=Methylobacter psychrophilus TaxID=96941 RepID=UPI0021D4A2B8|nr:primase-like DNA-binding domain-containing protein [Methylobacter psychrophilus]